MCVSQRCEAIFIVIGSSVDFFLEDSSEVYKLFLFIKILLILSISCYHLIK